MKKKWRCRSPRTFFGLTSEYMEAIYEQFFYMKYNGGWSFSEAYNLPVKLREWFVERLVKQIETENKAIEDAQRGTGGSNQSAPQTLTAHNSPGPPPNWGGKKTGR